MIGYNQYFIVNGNSSSGSKCDVFYFPNLTIQLNYITNMNCLIGYNEHSRNDVLNKRCNARPTPTNKAAEAAKIAVTFTPMLSKVISITMT